MRDMPRLAVLICAGFSLLCGCLLLTRLKMFAVAQAETLAATTAPAHARGGRGLNGEAESIQPETASDPRSRGLAPLSVRVGSGARCSQSSVRRCNVASPRGLMNAARPHPRLSSSVAHIR